MWLWIVLACMKAPQLPTYTHVVNRIEQTYPYSYLPEDFVKAATALEVSAKKAKTAEELRPVVSELIGYLGLSHYAIFPSAFERQASQTYFRAGTLGMQLRWIDDGFYVVGKEPSHPQPELIQLGWNLVSVDGQLLPQSGDDLRQVMRAQAQLICEYGEDVRIELKSSDDFIETQLLPCVGLEGDRFSFGNVPTQVADFHSEVLEDNIHYIQFHHFLTPIREPFAKAIEKAIEAEARGLIIDLRGNTGGMIAVGQGLMGYLLSTPDLLFAQQISQESEFRYIIYPRPPEQVFKGTVVVLIDEMSVSTAEILARAVQLSERGIIIGAPSAGRVLSSMVEGLPNGDRLQLVIADLESMDKQSLEGVGVQPDILVPYDIKILRQQKDAALQAAQTHILNPSGATP